METSTPCPVVLSQEYCPNTQGCRDQLEPHLNLAKIFKTFPGVTKSGLNFCVLSVTSAQKHMPVTGERWVAFPRQKQTRL